MNLWRVPGSAGVLASSVIGSLLLIAVPSAGMAADAKPGDNAPGPSAPAAAPDFPLVVGNRDVFTFRGAFGLFGPDQRLLAASALIDRARKSGEQLHVDSTPSGDNYTIRINGRGIFNITPGDTLGLEAEDRSALVEQTVQQLQQALDECSERRDGRRLLLAAAKTLLATSVLGGLLWLLMKNRRWVDTLVIRRTATQADQLASHTWRIVGLQNVVPLIRALLTFIFWVLVGLAVYCWLEFVLHQFPHTRPFGEKLGRQFFEVLQGFGVGLLYSLPNLGVVAFVWFTARFLSTATRRFFTAVSRGQIKSPAFDPATTVMTQRICSFMIWVIAVIVAFPYIPGSQTPAFQGISVLAGLMITVGASVLIAQLVGGMVVVYNRSCRVGDYVRVGDHEGTLAQIGFFSTRMVTARNEEVVIPNSQLASGILINYSKLNDSAGVILPLKITIGYDAPWRQVHALLLQAAARTPGLKRDPAPSVVQNVLSDFYVEYQLNTVVEKPDKRLRILSELNANVQDAFNEAGVQIMSPHYRGDPAKPIVVPKEKWFTPPARPE
jgi:small-conductance mechanosensitive channel